MLIKKLSELLPEACIKFAEPMKLHTTFKIGGICDAMLIAKSEGELIEALNFCKLNSIPCFILGNGSNLLVKDGGIRGLVIKLGEDMAKIQFKGNTVTAQAGARMSTLCRDCIQKNFSGLETLGGIPGTVGGAIKMNAGAYGKAISDSVFSVNYIDNDLNCKVLQIEPEDFGYRFSVFAKNKWIITSAQFKLNRDTDGFARQKFDYCQSQRKQKQPINIPSAGSVFKRPEGHFAGALIENAGLKGRQFNGAMVSDLHAGFIVNANNATAFDVLELINLVKDTVYQNSGVMLETEIEIIGEDK